MKEIKQSESVECEMCGSLDCYEFEHGVAGICRSCGNQWGDWEYYEDDEDENTEALDRAEEMWVLPKFLYIEDVNGLNDIRVEYQEYSDRQHIIKNISYDQVASAFFRGFMTKLFERGFSKDQIKAYIQSVYMRHNICDPAEDKIHDIGYSFADKVHENDVMELVKELEEEEIL